MAPKNKGKKGGKRANDDDDEYWEKNATSKIENLALSDDPEPIAEEEEDGLMSMIQGKKKKGKKGKAETSTPALDFSALEIEEAPEEEPELIVATATVDDEWPEEDDKKKKKKDKKSKKSKKEKVIDEEDEASEPNEVAIPPVETKEEEVGSFTSPPPPETAVDGEEAEVDDGEPKILSKKEKERLKKEKEKAKKKAQVAAKKAAAKETIDDEPTSTPNPPTALPKADINDEPPPQDETEEGTTNKKKKKKKAKKDDETAPAPAPAAGKKKAGGIGALKALMEEKKRIEEEERQKAELERLRIEEEERRAEEEEKRKEEDKQRKKEKEKAKKELAKKEGRLLTKKQREEKAIAEKRKAALLASGVVIEGFQAAPAQKKPVYKKKKAQKDTSMKADQSGESPPKDSATTTPIVSEKNDDDVKSDWDASSDEEKEPSKADVKSDWDDSDEEDVPPPKAESKSVPSSAPTSKPVPNKVSPKTTAPIKAPTKPLTKQNKKADTSSSSEESSGDSDSDSGSGSDSDSGSDSNSDSEEELTTVQKLAAQRKAEAAVRRQQTREAALAARTTDELRSPICCILGHVDTGKTKLLDKIRQTNVQEGEAGGITQQIGATYFPVKSIIEKTAILNKTDPYDYKIPGLLIIDTPGHESFTNLRSRGSSLCNIAILVIDIMHGLEQQTLESLKLLRDRKTPFVVALNKIDRIYSWEPTPNNSMRDSLSKQTKQVQREFHDRVEQARVALAEQGLNSCLWWDNTNFARNVSIVPTSAHTGEGIPDMIRLLCRLTQERMGKDLMFCGEIEGTVLEVKVIEGLGTTIDIVLVNGHLREGDRIVLCGLNGPIATTIRAILTPPPLREMRVKSRYVHHKVVKAALGVKIVAADLEKAIAGSRLLVVGPDDDEEELENEVMSDLTTLMNSITKSGNGVSVQSSTLGSLEALLEFLRTSDIPVSQVNIGPVHKKDVMKVSGMIDKGVKELAVILAFDVEVDKEAEKLAEEMGVRIFKADIIYHLFDKFTAYNKEIVEAKRKDAAPQAVWPCRLKIIACFCKRDPIILGVDILDGTLRVGTPLAVVRSEKDPSTGAVKREIIELGKVTSLEINHKTFDMVKKSQAGAGVAVKIEHAVYQSAKMFGRHFDDSDEVLSRITRSSIDVLKSTFKADVSTEEWHLIKAMKGKFNIP